MGFHFSASASTFVCWKRGHVFFSGYGPTNIAVPKVCTNKIIKGVLQKNNDSEEIEP